MLAIGSVRHARWPSRADHGGHPAVVVCFRLGERPFARITAPEGLPAWEQLRPKATWGWNILLWPVAAAVFLGAFVAGGGSRAATACSVAASRRLQRMCVNRFRRGRYLTKRDNGR